MEAFKHDSVTPDVKSRAAELLWRKHQEQQMTNYFHMHVFELLNAPSHFWRQSSVVSGT